MSARLLCLGDNVVDRYVDDGVMYPGGNALNVAVHARRLGIETAYLGVTGADAAGELVRSALAAEGVDASRVEIVPGMTAYADVRVVDGNRVFGHGDPGISRFVLDEAQLTDAAGFDLVHTGDCSGVESQLPQLAVAARRLSFDFSEQPWPYVEGLAQHVDIAIVSLPSGAESGALAFGRRVRDLGPSTVAVTGGASGAWLLTEESTSWAPAGTGPIVDTLGAGDAFIARLLAGLLRAEQPGDALTAATAYASAACATYGAFGHPGAPITTLAPDLEQPRRAATPPRS